MDELHLYAAATGVFTQDELIGLPPIVRQYFTQSVATGTPLVPAVRLTMHGRIKAGRWMPFRATEILHPLRGFSWHVRVARGLVTGVDRYLDHAAEMRMKALGVIPIVNATGPDVTRSAAGRAGGETLWAPIALLPRFGARWTETGPTSASVHLHVEETPVTIEYRFDDTGRIRSSAMERWGDPDRTGTWTWHHIGSVVERTATFDALTIPSAGMVGWHYGTDRWKDGQFFQYEITDLQLATEPPHG